MIRGSTDYGPEVEIFPDVEALSHAAAVRFADASRESISSKGTFAVATSGGSTPRNLFLLLGSDYYIRAIEWQHLHMFWADERCVPPGHEQSNFKLAFDAFLSKVPVPPGNLHRVKGEESPEQGAKEYEAALREFFGQSMIPAFDLILLGLGEDGHTASLFPGSAALAEQERLTVAVRKQPPELDRITLTLPVLNNAHQIVFLAAGSAKEQIVQKLLEEPGAKEKYPAGLVHPARGRLTWLIDKAAAGLLQKKYRN